MKRFKEEARKLGRLIDGTQGRRTRSIVITDSHHIVLSALQTETVAERLERGAVGTAQVPPSAAPALPPDDLAGDLAVDGAADAAVEAAGDAVESSDEAADEAEEADPASEAAELDEGDGEGEP